jgi:hypothetical protein
MSISNLFKPNNYDLYCDTLTANSETITNLNVTTLTAGTANITTENTTTANITNGNIVTATITTGNITTGNITTGNITTGNITTLNVTNPKTDFQVFIPGIEMNVKAGGTTWTNTVDTVAGVHYIKNSAGAGTSTLYTDISQMYRTAASKGLQLASLTYIYNVATQDLTSITGLLFNNVYSDSATVQTTGITLTGTALPVAQNSPLVYVKNRTVLSPAYQASNTNYSLETTFVTQANTIIQFYGVLLNFSANWY